MANMSYCRMENTAVDLRDCIDAIENGEYTPGEMSRSELQGLSEIIELAEYLTQDLEYIVSELIDA